MKVLLQAYTFYSISLKRVLLQAHTFYSISLKKLFSAGTYIPPGPMLNSASTRLACLEDVEIDVSGPGAPHHLFRRRVFAPEDNRNERYLTASDVVKVSSLFSFAGTDFFYETLKVKH
jgi:hypothetical protein